MRDLKRGKPYRVTVKTTGETVCGVYRGYEPWNTQKLHLFQIETQEHGTVLAHWFLDEIQVRKGQY